jgi:hypothetical protein
MNSTGDFYFTCSRRYARPTEEIDRLEAKADRIKKDAEGTGNSSNGTFL